MRLIELEPTFIRFEGLDSFWRDVEFSVADGISFLCPLCYVANNGIVGTHSIIVLFTRCNPAIMPTWHRWDMNGSKFDDLTISPSIRITVGCNWHGFIRNGEIVNC